MSRTGNVKLSTYKLAFESWLSQYNRFDWDNPEEGNNWSNLMHKNVKEIGIGAALTKECAVNYFTNKEILSLEVMFYDNNTREL